jgi:hypothetical protein
MRQTAAAEALTERKTGAAARARLEAGPGGAPTKPPNVAAAGVAVAAAGVAVTSTPGAV